MKKHIIDIFSDDIFSSKLSKNINYFIVFLIVISTLEIILGTEVGLAQFGYVFNTIYFFTSTFFLIEIFLRFWVAGSIHEQYKGFGGKIRYAFHFYTFIDILAVLPFILGIFGLEVLLYFKAIRVLRILKIMRYLPSVDLLQRSIANKKSELLISLQAIFITAILLSIGLYYAESRIPESLFSSILQAFLWSVAKFIGNIAGYGDFDPVTTIGKILGTLNGILGIAIFALPAGIIASGFIDEMGNDNKSKEIKLNIEKLNKYLNRRYEKRKTLDNQMAFDRYSTFENIVARFLFTESEIFECIRNSDNMRFRAMKSSENIKYNDTKLIERFFKNTEYGYKLLNDKSNVYIINPMGKTERCISHYTYTICDILGYNYISREVEMETTSELIIGTNFADQYIDFENNRNTLPASFLSFMNDISQIKKNDVVIVISSAASGRADFIIEYGNKKDVEGIIEDCSTIYDERILTELKSQLFSRAESLQIVKASQKVENFSFKVEDHAIGNYKNQWFGKTVHNLTGANVVTLYVNIRHLIGEDGIYYGSLKYMLENLEAVFGNFKAKI